jgi:pimeloyl-ACP methyl ester carboxylesterase
MITPTTQRESVLVRITRPTSFFAILMIIIASACARKPEEGKANAPAAAALHNDSTLVPASPPADFKHQTAKVNGINIHYVIGGKGAPLLLIHGFGQNWYMWNRLLPELSKHFTVIAPDMRGVGESDKPADGYDKKSMASDMHELMKSLGYSSVNVAGHDIGLMVAYAYAATYPDEVKKLALMDALLPGVEPVWSQVRSMAWWFGFFGFPVSGQLVAGQERTFLTNFWPIVGYKNDSFTREEVDEFVRAYAQSGGTTGAFHWFGAFGQDALDNKEFMKTKLKMPMLTVGADHSAGSYLEDHGKLVAENVKGVVIHDAGHWIVQEQTDQTLAALMDFFVGK